MTDNDVHYEVTHYIDGRFVAGTKPFAVVYPATGAQIGTVPEGAESEIDEAVQAARRAFPEWSGLKPSERRTILHRWADAIEEDGEQLARLETFDVGRTITDNRGGYIARTAANLRFFADFAVNVPSEAYPMENGYINYVLRHPLGVAGLITPWNVPLLLETWKIGPALAFGNTVVLKPAESTPLGAWHLARLADAAGVPPGVFNVVHGFGPASAGEFLTKHPDVNMLSFTGETTTGQAIMATAAATLKRLSFELGGKGANIIFADTDIEQAVDISMRAAFFNQGEFCLASPRIFVERPLYDQFVAAFVAKAESLRVGDPFDERTQMGSLITAEHLERVLSFVEGAVQDGARIATGGKRLTLDGPLAGGSFMAPTVILDAGPDDAICQKEVFGPVVTVTPFDDEAEVIRWANSTPYGLSSVIQTKDIRRAHRTAAALHVGTVWVNDFFVRDLRVPFGGMKSSGIGREGGHYSMDVFTEPVNICIAV